MTGETGCVGCGTLIPETDSLCRYCGAAARGADVGRSPATIAHVARMFHVLEARLSGEA